MPTAEIEKRLEVIKAKQRQRGVIEPLVGRHWPEKGIGLEQPMRQQLAVDLKRARARQGYGVLGTHYEREMTDAFPDFKEFISEKIGKAKQEGRKVRWLDIGPGDPYYFMTYFENKDPEGKTIDLHTLSPEQILPKGNPTIPRQARANLVYRRLRNRLKHHVGAIETYAPEKLGKFHVIVSSVGGTLYSKQPVETLFKVAKLLHVGCKAFVDAPGHTDIPRLQKQLGESFSVQSKYDGFGLKYNLGSQYQIVITRVH